MSLEIDAQRPSASQLNVSRDNMTSRKILILFIGFALLNPSSGFSKTHITQGYAKTEYVFTDGGQVSVYFRRNPSFIVYLPKSFFFNKVTHIQFVDIGIKNLKKDSVLVHEVQSKRIPLFECPSTIGLKNERWYKAAWHPWKEPIPEKYASSYGLGGSEIRKLPDAVPFNDLEIYGSILFYDSNGVKKSKRGFSLLIIRDYKTEHETLLDQGITAVLTAIIPEPWGVKPPALGRYRFAESSLEVMYAINGGKKINGATVEYFGKITIENGEVNFNEMAEKRKSYHIKEDGYEWSEKIDGHPRRLIRKTKKVYLDPSIAPYRTIYEWGYRNPE